MSNTSKLHRHFKQPQFLLVNLCDVDAKYCLKKMQFADFLRPLWFFKDKNFTLVLKQPLGRRVKTNITEENAFENRFQFC